MILVLYHQLNIYQYCTSHSLLILLHGSLKDIYTREPLKLTSNTYLIVVSQQNIGVCCIIGDLRGSIYNSIYKTTASLCLDHDTLDLHPKYTSTLITITTHTHTHHQTQASKGYLILHPNTVPMITPL